MSRSASMAVISRCRYRPFRCAPLRSAAVTPEASHELRELVDLAKSGKLRAVPVERVTHDDPNPALDRVRSGAVKAGWCWNAGLHASGGGRTSP